jgi:hypothetical protein
MSQMRQWVVQMGISWDAWWGYCRQIQDAARAQEELQEIATPSQDPVTPSSPMEPKKMLFPADQEANEGGMERPGTGGMERPGTGSSLLSTAERQKEAIEAEKALKKKRLEERKALDARRREQYAMWEQESEENVRKEMHANWKDSIRSYTYEMFNDDPIEKMKVDDVK